MAWTSPKTWATGDVLTAADMNTYLRDNTDHLNDDIEGTIESNATTATAGTDTTTSTSYTDLAGGAGPSRTVTVRPTGRLLISWAVRMQNDTTGASCFTDFALTGANSRSASDTTATQFVRESSNSQARYAGFEILTGLSAGSTTITLKYRVSAGTGSFARRTIAIIPL
jgi:hypothetical protein